MKAIDQQLGGHLLDQQSELKSTLIFGADKWGQDVLKTIKGAETSIIVGLISALLAVTLGTLLGQFLVILVVGSMIFSTGFIIFLLPFHIYY